jgi:rhodanese-related sulfurtransferase
MLMNIDVQQLLAFMKNHWALWLGFAVVLALLVIEEAKKKFKSSNIVSSQVAIKLINHEEAVVVDMRDGNLFKAGHIVHAHSVSKGDIEAGAKKIVAYKEKPVLLIATLELDAQKAAEQLRTHGFNKVYVLAEGIGSWQRANLPLVK